MAIGNTDATEHIEHTRSKPTQAIYQEFLGLQTTIHPEGDEAKITIRTTEGSIKLMMSFEHMGRANTEIRRAAILMLYRQSMRKDAGEAKYAEMLKTAMEPDRISIVVDPNTADRLFMLEFFGHSPIPLRLSPEMMNSALVDLAEKTRSAAN